METRRPLKDLIAAAVAQAEQEKLAAHQPKPEVKTAEAAPALDVGDTKVALALAKVGHELAVNLKKQAEEATAASASLTRGPAQSAPQTTLASPGRTPDMSPSAGPLSSKDTSEKPGAPSLTPTTTSPQQEFPEAKKLAAAQVLAETHARYAAAAAVMNKTANQPLGGVTDGAKPVAGEPPEKRPDAPSSHGTPLPPTTPEAVAAFTNLNADKQHTADMPAQVASPAAGASRPDAAMAHVQAGASTATKAAAMRAYLNVLPPTSKLAAAIRNQLAELNKQAGDPALPINPPVDLAAQMNPTLPPPVRADLPGSPVAPGIVPTPDARGSNDPGIAPALVR
jgi:hypothetical protein